MRKGILFVLSGPSGAGKGTVLKQVVPHLDGVALSISVTTRDPRPGELDGIHYYFKTEEEFSEMIRQDAFLEYVGKFHHHYGTPKEPVQRMLEQGTDVILEIETMGADKVRAAFPEAVFIFITPPTFQELERRLTGRGSEDSTQRQLRCNTAKEEYKSLANYDYVAINDDLDRCVESVIAIVESERIKTARNPELVEKFLNL